MSSVRGYNERYYSFTERYYRITVAHAHAYHRGKNMSNTLATPWEHDLSTVPSGK